MPSLKFGRGSNKFTAHTGSLSKQTQDAAHRGQSFQCRPGCRTACPAALADRSLHTRSASLTPPAAGPPAPQQPRRSCGLPLSLALEWQAPPQAVQQRRRALQALDRPVRQARRRRLCHLDALGRGRKVPAQLRVGQAVNGATVRVQQELVGVCRVGAQPARARVAPQSRQGVRTEPPGSSPICETLLVAAQPRPAHLRRTHACTTLCRQARRCGRSASGAAGRART